MIIAEPKPLKEIASSIRRYNNVMILGCGTCVTVCLTGGEKEAEILSHELRDSEYLNGDSPFFIIGKIERQCERDMVRAYLEIPETVDAILSMACGAGVQTLSGIYRNIPVIPALNTTFIGGLEEPGMWTEKCRGCGDCILAGTGGICPVTRCAKGIFNGPCGGSSGGKCEIGEDVECAWSLIIERLNELGRIEDYNRIIPFRDWSNDRAGGPRKLIRPDR